MVLYTVYGMRVGLKPELEFFDVEAIPWQDLGNGLSERILSGDPSSGNYTRMLLFHPGVVTSEGTLAHKFWEEVWIVSGSIEDLRLKQVFRAGMYACRPPGMPHGPWQTERGALMLEIRRALT